MIFNDAPVAFCVNLDTANAVNTKLRLLREFVGGNDGHELVYLPDAQPEAAELDSYVDRCGSGFDPLQ